MPVSIDGIGMGIPMSPVEQTRTSLGGHPSSDAASSHIRPASCRPGSPVAALALPLLRMTAAARPPVSARCCRETTTGAAVILLVVKTAAVDTATRSALATSGQVGDVPRLDATGEAGGVEAGGRGHAHVSAGLAFGRAARAPLAALAHG